MVSSCGSRPFLFVGNGPYRNRGCEAIVRGTMEILSASFGPETTVRAGVMAAPETVALQQAGEIDPRVRNISVSRVGSRFTRKWFMGQANAKLGTSFQHHTRDLIGPAQGVRAALQLGGDNYSLDYGHVMDYVAVDRFLQRQGVPVFIWGASVGPFDKEPKLARVLHDHLKTLDGIFVRETRTQAYLARYGITENVYLVADPAFVMQKTAPSDAVQALVTDDTIGINISPLVARFAGAESVDAWRAQAAAMIEACAARTKRPILLIPHVGSPLPDEDDYAFLRSLKARVEATAGVTVAIVPALGAAELKWIIGRCAAFAGARTHSTIAALSSHVPTLSLSYSVKAQGINEDIFDHLDFCLSVKTVTPEHFADAMARLITEGPAIRAHLDQRIRKMRIKATDAGRILKQKLGANDAQ